MTSLIRSWANTPASPYFIRLVSASAVVGSPGMWRGFARFGCYRGPDV